ncbi:MAG: YicC/YloC family endoribonuclease [Myxococcota bacterium]
MIRSMTGYGRGEASANDLTVVVELKSVNNRFRDINLRSPREYLALEPRINALLKDPFARGRIDAYVRRTVGTTRQRVVADASLANEYALVVNEVAQQMVGFVEREVPFTFILSQPGVMTISEEPVDVTLEWDIVEIAVQSAILDLMQMREAEGATIQREFEQMVDEMRTIVGEIEAASIGINERLQKKLQRRIGRLLGDQADPYRIAQEVAHLADKADVAEEVVRLRSHLDQFTETLGQEDPVGRRLDFLLQEMNREVNTIGSKAAEHPVSQRVVLMKSVLERMREQSANIE